MSEIDYAARVAKGAALLDEKRPGWERLIDLEILDVENGHCCVTAQFSGMVYGDSSWRHGMEQLGLNMRSYTEHGFRTDDDRVLDYPTLNTLWKDLISKRLATKPADS
jgi:hypothetical protein